MAAEVWGLTPPDVGGPSPADALSVTVRAILRNTDRYTLGTWYPATFGSWTTGWLDFGGWEQDQIRPPASAAFGLATSLATGAYDPTVTGVSRAEAVEIAVKLIRSLTFTHKANNSAGWGQGSQTSLWAAYLAQAGWLLASEIRGSLRWRLALVVAMEADYTTDTQDTVFWKASDGTENYPGDSKAEELAWQSMILQIACVMFPGHPRHDTWHATMVERMKASWAIQADALAGWNVNDDGTIVNHNRLHPDYMATITQTLQAAPLFALAGRPTPVEATHNVPLIWDAYRQVTFTVPPYQAPGGTIYVSGSDALYYPEGNDWGTDRRAHVMACDAMVDSLALAVTDDPVTWGQLHADKVLTMQQRDTTGQTYQAAGEDTYAGREQWVAVHVAQAWLARWVVAAGKYPA